MHIRKKLFAALLAALLAIPALAQDTDILARAEAMLREGRYAEAYSLLEPLENRLAGDLRFDYLLARSALESGRPAEATFIYERILAVAPDLVAVRMEMGRAFLAMREYARAKLEFETVLRFSKLAPGLREQAQAYAKAAADRLAGKLTTLRGYLEYGYGYDSNPRLATTTASIVTPNDFLLILDSTSLKRPDHYHALTAGGEAIHELGERWSLYAGGDARLRGHRVIDTADYAQLDARAGVGYAEGSAHTRVGLTVGRYVLDYDTVRESAGATIEHRRLIAGRNQLSASVLIAGYRFPPERFSTNDYDLALGTVGWLRAINAGRGLFGASLIAGVEKARSGRLDGDRPHYGARLTYQNSLTERTGLFAYGGVQRGEYKETNPIFGMKRLDTLYDVTAGLTWRLGRNWSLRPQLVYMKNESNLELFDFSRTDASLNLRVEF